VNVVADGGGRPGGGRDDPAASTYHIHISANWLPWSPYRNVNWKSRALFDSILLRSATHQSTVGDINETQSTLKVTKF
jgi:hypothetical protein